MGRSFFMTGHYLYRDVPSLNQPEQSPLALLSFEVEKFSFTASKFIMPSTADPIVYPPMVSSLAGRARTIFAGDLSYFCSEDDLFRFFVPLGRVLNVSIARKNEASLMYGFVEFESLETAEKMAQEYNGYLFMGRHLRIYALGNYTGPASYFPNDKPSTFCVHVSFVTHNLHKVINEEYLRQMFVSMNEDVYDVAIRRYYRQRHRQYGYAFVDFLSKDTAVGISQNWKERDHDGVTIKCTLGHRVVASQETDAGVGKRSGDQIQSVSKGDSAFGDTKKDHAAPASRPFHSKNTNEDDNSNKAGLTFYRPNQPHPVAARKGAPPQSDSTSGATAYPYQAQPLVMDGSGFAAQPGGIMMYYPGSYLPVPFNAATSTSMGVPVMSTYPVAVPPSTYPSPNSPAPMGMYYNQPPVQYAIPMSSSGGPTVAAGINMQAPAPVSTSNQYPSNSGVPAAPQQYIMYPPHSFPQYHVNNGNGPPSFR